MRKESKASNGWAAFIQICVISVLIDVVVAFTSNRLTFQSPAVALATRSFLIILFIIALVWSMKYVHLLIDMIIAKHGILSIVIAIINPVAGLLMVILIYHNIQELLTMEKVYPYIHVLAKCMLICVLTACIYIQLIVEIKALQKVREVLHRQ